jgi:hypothetical protein
LLKPLTTTSGTVCGLAVWSGPTEGTEAVTDGLGAVLARPRGDSDELGDAALALAEPVDVALPGPNASATPTTATTATSARPTANLRVPLDCTIRDLPRPASLPKGERYRRSPTLAHAPEALTPRAWMDRSLTEIDLPAFPRG